MRQLDRWEVDPLAASWLVLEGVEYECGGKMQLKSNDNRRLYCLKKHQENVREQEWVVYVRLRCGRIPPDPILSRCLDRNNPLDGGRTKQPRLIHATSTMTIAHCRSLDL